LKYVKLTLCIFLVCVLFSGCSFRFSSSIDDLISPVSPFGDNAEIKNVLDGYLSNGYTLKAASTGDYITSYNFFDLDSDSQEEALAFYEPGDNLGTVSMALIAKSDGTWTVRGSIPGEGREVHSMAFEDVNGDGLYEVIVCWDAIANSSNHQLCVYQYAPESQDEVLYLMDKPITVNNYTSVNMYDGDTKELLLFEISNGTSQSNKAELYSFSENKAKLVGETKLDSHVTDYQKLQAEEVDGGYRIYADALGSDGLSMLTELIYWSDTYKTIISPFYSYQTGLTQDTIRSLPVPSTDVNDDGILEIPIDYDIDAGGISKLDWRVFRHSVLLHSAYSLYAARDGYLVVIPDEYIDSITTDYDEKTHEMTVSAANGSETVFTLMPVLKATYSPEKYPGYVNVREAFGYCYLAKIGSSSAFPITADELTKSIKVFD